MKAVFLLPNFNTDFGREKTTAAKSLRKLSWATVGYVQSPGMALRREFQAHRMLKHLIVVSKLSGFKVPT